MTANPSPPQPVAATGAGPVAPSVPSPEIDASCRVPVMLLFICAVLWLLTASGFGIIASLKFHSPGFLAGCPWLTYGRVHPAQLNALIYGFAVQAGLGAVLWMICRLGRTRLVFAPGIVFGTIVWNVGVKLGIIGILCGENTGHDWLEMPRYASLVLFSGYLLIGLGVMRNFRRRGPQPLYISQWFILAAVFWFPWIYSTANLLLVAKPVRGALQAALDSWYINNLTVIWFGFVGLAAIFYFIPKIAKRPLHSHYLAIFVFWTMALFGSWGGIAPGSPLPSWMAAMSTVAAVLMILPLVATVINIRRTAAGDCAMLWAGVSGKFIVFGLVAFILTTLLTALTSLEGVSLVTNFTWAVPAQLQLTLLGFFAMTMFGAVYYIVPRLMGVEMCPRLAGAHFWLAVLGLLLSIVPLALGGVVQGQAMNLHEAGFLDVMLGTLPYLRASTTGDLLLAVGNLLLLLNLAGVLYRVGRPAALAAWAANTVKSAEVLS